MNAADFREFIRAPRPAGCQSSEAFIRRLLQGSGLEGEFEELIRGTPGGTEGNQNAAKPWVQTDRDIITDRLGADEPEPPSTIPLSPDTPRPRVRNYAREAPTGTSVSYAIRKLSKARPDLYERVKAGEIKPYRAMVEAGFQKRMVNIPVEVEGAARILRRHFHGESLEALIAELQRHETTS